MTRLIPILLAVGVIVALTMVEGTMTQRWGDSRHSAYCAKLLDDVPTSVGKWVGTDHEVDERVQVVAGARNYVSRSYKHEDSGETVTLWLIVGHSSNTARHTPDVCYRANGFQQLERDKHTLKLENGDEATFFTGNFVRSEDGISETKDRVYWSWFNARNNSAEPVRWIAPDNPRFAIGSAPSLYKIYFTTHGAASEVEDSQNSAMQFAGEFLPVLESVLEQANGSVPAGFEPSA